MSRFDPWAATLFRRHRRALVRYVARYTGDPDLAEDVVQDAFLRLRERPPAERSDVRGWLFTVATRLAIDRMRVANRRSELLRSGERQIDMAPLAPDPADAVERDETRRVVRAALDRLSDKERTAVLMREEGFKHREIAAAVGTTTRSVGTLLDRAHRKLAQGLGMKEDGHDPR